MRLDFGKLLADYERMMFDTLRGFSLGVDFLETWVPSEDSTESAETLVELAAEGGLTQLEIAFGPDDLRKIDMPRLRACAERFGNESMIVKGGLSILSVQLKPSASTLRPAGIEDVNPLYRTAIETCRENWPHEGDIADAPPGHVRVNAHVGPLSLSAHVAVTSDLVRSMRHSGAATGAEATVMEQLCEIAEGLPIQEVSDHAVIALEQHLRSPLQPTGVAGIVLAERMDPVLAKATDLTRALAREYRSVSGKSSVQNFYDRPTGSLWQSLNEDDRAALIKQIVAERAAEIGMGPDDITGLEAKSDARIIVQLAAHIPRAMMPVLLRKLEAVIQKHIDPRLEILVTEKKDDSELRRL